MSENGSAKTTSGGWLRWAPLAGFAAVAAVFAVQLANPSDGFLTSQLIDEPAPVTDAPTLGASGADADGRLTNADLATGRPVLVNFFASWCPPCEIEHIDLMRLAALDAAGEIDVEMIGVLHGDTEENARRYLDRLGDPFDVIGLDPERRLSLEWGLEGLPETFILDGQGRVVFKHSGPIVNDELQRIILPALREAAAR